MLKYGSEFPEVNLDFRLTYVCQNDRKLLAFSYFFSINLLFSFEVFALIVSFLSLVSIMKFLTTENKLHNCHYFF